MPRSSFTTALRPTRPSSPIFTPRRATFQRSPRRARLLNGRGNQPPGIRQDDRGAASKNLYRTQMVDAAERRRQAIAGKREPHQLCRSDSRHAAEDPLHRRLPRRCARTNQTGNQNQASVDSELATLGFIPARSPGRPTIRIFKASVRFSELADMPLLLVCRLDAPTADIVRRMITDAVADRRKRALGPRLRGWRRPRFRRPGRRRSMARERRQRSAARPASR